MSSKEKKQLESFLQQSEISNGTSYSNTDLKIIDTDFKSFCRNNKVDFIQANQIGLIKSKVLLIRYFSDQIDGNLTKGDCENLYRLIKDPWDNSKLERHEILSSYIFSIGIEKNLKLERILILGAGTGGEYENLRRLHPRAKFVITDISEQALNSFHLKNKDINGGYTTQILDIFCPNSFSDFLNSQEKFDLIIASGVYRYAPSKQKKYSSAEFIYKNLLEHKGLFCIAEVSQDAKYDDPFILRRITPIFTKEVQTEMRINPTKFVFYQKPFKPHNR